MDANSIILIVGSSSDVGTALIRSIADDYDTIWCHYRTDSVGLDELKNTYGDKIRLIRADLSNMSDTESMINTITESGLIPGSIVHLASDRPQNVHFKKMKWNDFQKDIDISLRSIVMISESFIPHMVSQKHGRIVLMLTSYVLGVPPKYLSSYITVKYSLLGFTKALAAEYSSKGITVNAVSPDMMDTSFIAELPDMVKEMNAAANPSGRLLHAEEIIPTIKHLLSDDAAMITGQNIAITGGTR